jgi:hypothetical protein
MRFFRFVKKLSRQYGAHSKYIESILCMTGGIVKTRLIPNFTYVMSGYSYRYDDYFLVANTAKKMVSLLRLVTLTQNL